MKSIAEIAIGQEKMKDFFKHPRFKLLDEFVRRINADRRANFMRPLPTRVIAIKTAHLSLTDLDFLLKKCQQSNNFGRCFFGLLKNKPKDNG